METSDQQKEISGQVLATTSGAQGDGSPQALQSEAHAGSQLPATFDTYAVEELERQVQLVQRVMDSLMKEDSHYGTIPGTGKPTLFKAGAEKLNLMFRLSPRYDIEREDFPATDDRPAGHREYTVHCKLFHISTDELWGEGVGSCSTLESKYRYRKAQITCPECGKETVIKGKKEYGGGWLCWKKKGGCGAKWDDGAAAIEDQERGKVENPDIADVYNTTLKMAKKRAHVDAVLTCTAASDLFTQDLEEDFSTGGGGQSQRRPERTRQQESLQPSSHQTRQRSPRPEPQEYQEAEYEIEDDEEEEGDTRTISRGQVTRLWAIAKENGFTNDGVHRLIAAGSEGYQSVNDIKRRDYEGICSILEQPEKSAKWNKDPAQTDAFDQAEQEAEEGNDFKAELERFEKEMREAADKYDTATAKQSAVQKVAGRWNDEYAGAPDAQREQLCDVIAQVRQDVQEAADGQAQRKAQQQQDRAPRTELPGDFPHREKLETGGVTTAEHIIRLGRDGKLEEIDGIGPTYAKEAVGAAERLRETGDHRTEAIREQEAQLDY